MNRAVACSVLTQVPALSFARPIVNRAWCW